MKKNKNSNVRKQKRAKKNTERKTRVSKSLNIRKKKAHDKEVREQLNDSEQFIQKVNDFLMMYGTRLDADGVESLGVNSSKIIAILESIDKDLKDFDEEHLVLKNEAEEFFAETGGNEFSWLPTSIDLVSRIDNLRTRYSELYVLNHQTLLTYDH
ncbi:hypothetical protein GKD59_23610 [Parabacteroides distasonis]|uniref:Uncharacterized protein n=1 Tax=Parabacteroides distasonis TaxID=823 RepID=A0A7K0GPG8_PARDI|nr:hypothetical protein [Parabacteroides distasonis]MRY60805.1 hypothetical protein [Parabacteroides distasonis]